MNINIKDCVLCKTKSQFRDVVAEFDIEGGYSWSGHYNKPHLSTSIDLWDIYREKTCIHIDPHYNLMTLHKEDFTNYNIVTYEDFMKTVRAPKLSIMDVIKNTFFPLDNKEPEKEICKSQEELKPKKRKSYISQLDDEDCIWCRTKLQFIEVVREFDSDGSWRWDRFYEKPNLVQSSDLWDIDKENTCIFVNQHNWELSLLSINNAKGVYHVMSAESFTKSSRFFKNNDRILNELPVRKIEPLVPEKIVSLLKMDVNGVPYMDFKVKS